MTNASEENVKQLDDQQGGTFTTNTQTNPKEHCK